MKLREITKNLTPKSKIFSGEKDITRNYDWPTIHERDYRARIPKQTNRKKLFTRMIYDDLHSPLVALPSAFIPRTRSSQYNSTSRDERFSPT